MHFLFLFLIFYIFFWEERQSPFDFYQFVSSLDLYYEIQYLKKAFPDYGEFLFLHVTPCLIGGAGEGIVLFDVSEVKYFYFGLHGHPCTRVNHVCFM